MNGKVWCLFTGMAFLGGIGVGLSIFPLTPLLNNVDENVPITFDFTSCKLQEPTKPHINVHKCSDGVSFVVRY